MQLNSEFSGNFRMADQVNAGFTQAENGLTKAMRNGRARKHLQPGMLEQMRAQRGDAVKGTQDAEQASQQGQRDTFLQSPQANLMNGMDPLSRGLGNQMGRMFGIGSDPMSMNGMAQTAMLPNIDSITDPQQLMSLWQNGQTRQQSLSQSRSNLGRQQSQQVGQNRGFSQQMKKFGGLEKSFGAKEKAYAMKDKMFQNISKTMQTAAKAMETAAVGLDAAASAVEAAAAAVAAIPFVGAAIATALRIVAKGLRVVAKGMRAMGKTMTKMGAKMDQMAKKMGGLSKKMQSSKLANQARKVASKTRLTQGMQKLKQIQSQVSRISKELQANNSTLNKISARMKQLGIRNPNAMMPGMTMIPGMNQSGALDRLPLGQPMDRLGAFPAALLGHMFEISDDQVQVGLG